MFKKGRIILLTIIITMLLLIIPITIKATTNVLQVSNTTFNAIRGSEFETTIFIEEGSNVTGLTITLIYDKQLVTLKDYEELDASEVNVTDNTIIIVYSGADNISDQLDLVKLTFEVEEQIGVGNYDKWLYWAETEDDEAFTTDGFEGGRPNYVDLDIQTTFTPINIRAKGDAYDNKGDGKINARDASYILQHAAHMFTMDIVDQYYANVYEDYDSEGNPKISARDASLILQYAAHMDVEINDRYEIVFYTLNDNNEYIKYITKSIKKGEVLNNIPSLDDNHNWSKSQEEYIEVDFNNITEDISVYEYEETKCFEGLEYTLLSNDTYEVSGIGTCTDTEIIIPSIYNNKNVTSIGSWAFENVTSFSNIIIPSTVTSIGSWAFYNCTSLVNIDIPNSVTSIGEFAFSNCTSLESITIPSSVTSLGWHTFIGCLNLTIYCEASKKPSEWDNEWNYYRNPVIWDCNNNEDYKCLKTSTITVVAPTCSENGYKLYICNECGKEQIKVIQNMLPHTYQGNKCSICSYPLPSEGLKYELIAGNTYEVSGIGTCTDTNIVIPSYYNGIKVTSIGYEAFRNCTSLTNVMIPNSVTSIGNYAFAGCTSLESIEIPTGVKSIFSCAFAGCTSLKSVKIPNSVTFIGNEAFCYCTSLINITIPTSVAYINMDVFFGCESLTIYCEAQSQPSGWYYDWNYYNCPVVWDCNNNEDYKCLKTSTITVVAPTCTEKGYTLYKCNECGKEQKFNYKDMLGHIYEDGRCSMCNNPLPSEGLEFTLLDDGTYEVCGIGTFNGTELTIPSTYNNVPVTSIGANSLVNYSSLKVLRICEGITTIKINAFGGSCQNLTELHLPKSLVNYESAIWSSSSVYSIYYNGTVSDWCNINFGGIDSNPVDGFSTTIQNFYLLNENGTYYKLRNLVIPDYITIIGDYQFAGFSFLDKIIIPNSVESVGKNAFEGCSNARAYSTAESMPNTWDKQNLIVENKITLDIIYGVETKEGYAFKFDLNGGQLENGQTLPKLYYGNQFVLPTPIKEGYYFVGWYDASEYTKKYYTGLYTVEDDVILTAAWGYKVELEYGDNTIIAPYANVNEVKQDFIKDVNKFFGTSYTINSEINIWKSDFHKFFKSNGKWAPLLRYFADVNIEFVNNNGYTVINSTSKLFNLIQWEELQEGGNNISNYSNEIYYVLSFNVSAWLLGTQAITTWHYSPDYSSEEIQNKVLEYFQAPTSNIIYVEEGTSVVLPKVISEKGLNFKGWIDSSNIYYEAYSPIENSKLTASFGARVYLECPINSNINGSIIDIGDETYVLPILEDQDNYIFLYWRDKDYNQYTSINGSMTIDKLIAQWQWTGNTYTVEFVDNNRTECFISITEGSKLTYIPEMTKENYEFDGWWTQDGTQTGDWGEKITKETVITSNLTVYAKYLYIYTVYLNYSGAERPIRIGLEARDEFLKDFYNWCIKQGAFTKNEVSLETFKGTNYNGSWINYAGAEAGNPSSLFPLYDRSSMTNYFYAPRNGNTELRTNQILTNTQYFINDKDNYMKWAPYMEYIKKVCNDASRFWSSNATSYFIYELGRYFAADYEVFASNYTSLSATKRETLIITNCEHLYSIGGIEAFQTTVLGEVLPIPKMKNQEFVGWSDGNNYYTSFSDTSLDRKVLKPVFEYNDLIVVTPSNYLTTINSMQEGATILFDEGLYNEQIIINVSNITILGSNAGNSPYYQRNKETIFTEAVIIADGVTNIMIDGVAFENNGQICGEGNNKNISIINSYFSSLTNIETKEDGLICFNSKDKNVFDNIIVENCFFEKTNSLTIPLYIGGVNNLTVNNNYFGGSEFSWLSDAIRCFGGIMTGNINIQGNVFVDVGQYAIFMNSGVENVVLNVIGNHFINCGQNDANYIRAVLTINKVGVNDEFKSIINFKENIITNCDSGVRVQYELATADQLAVNVNDNVFNSWKKQILIGNNSSFEQYPESNNLINAESNYFEGGATENLFTGVFSYSNEYENKEDVPKYDNIIPQKK